MNTTSLAKSMNGALSVTDGEITMENGDITFSDGSVLSSIGDIALKSADNTFRGVNTFNNTTISTSSTTGALKVAGGVGVAGNLNLNGKINDIYLVSKNNGFMLSNNKFSSITGTDNVIMGLDAGYNTTSGSANVKIGYTSLYSNQSGSYNTAVGYNSGSVSTGNYNTFLGYNTFAFGPVQGGTAIGYNATITENYQIALGSSLINHYVKIPSAKVSSNSTTGALVVSGGVGIAGNLNVAGVSNVGALNVGALNVGGSLFSSYNAGGASITYPTSGYALNWNITGGGAETSLINVIPSTAYFDRGFNFHNVVQGVAFTGSSVPMFSLNAITSTLRSNLNVSGYVSITGELTTNNINNVRIKGATILGQQTIVIDASANSISNLLTSGQENYVFGKSNLISYTTGTHNVSIGLENLQAITTQSYNTAIGCNVLKLATSNFNVGIGEQVLKLTTTGDYNVGLGYNSLTENITGTNNIGIGYWSGRYSTGNYNTFLGDQTKTDNLAGYNNSTAVGAGATITASNQVVLGVAGASYFTVIPSTKASTASTDGALVVAGGVGVGGNVNLSANSKINWISTPFKVESNYNEGTQADRYGIQLQDGGHTRIYTAGSGNILSSIRFCLAEGLNTYVDLMKIAHNGDTVINSTTATTAYNEGALVVAGGIGVAGKVISNSEIQASSFYSPAGTLSVGGLSYLNGGVSLPAGKTIRWNTGDITVESYYAANDRYGLSYTGGITRLHTSDSYSPSSIRFSLATGLSTYTDLMTIAHNGDTKVASTTSGTVNLGTTPIAVNTTSASFSTAGDIGCAGNLISTGFLYSKYRIPLHDSGWFNVSNNTSYDSGSLAYLAYSETKYPYAIKISFRASGTNFPVYDITGMTFQAGNADGYSFRWINATSYSVRTGTSTVAKYYDGANYINAASGQYRIHILP